MTAHFEAGAASHESEQTQDTTQWHAINWSKVHQNVRRLQARIAQAVLAESRPVTTILNKI
jgi:hypothetical protein